MRDILPSRVVDAIGEQYREAANEAVGDFDAQHGDEDSLTGALGSVLRQRTHGSITVGETEYRWKTTSRKLRGRGRGAPERHTGMDAIIELEVWVDGAFKGRKSLPMQGKKEWRGQDKLLADQARKIAALSGGGIVIDYGPESYVAVNARVAGEAHGNRRGVPADAVRGLGDVLAEEFLECTVGSRNVYFDAERGLLLVMEEGRLRAVIGAKYRVLTKVTARPTWWSDEVDG